MKTRLTREESQHLISLGVPKEKASKVAWAQIRDFRGDEIPEEEQLRGVSDKPFSAMHVGFESFSTDDIFQLEDFLNGEILPKEIKTKDNIYWQSIFWTGTSYFVGYRNHNTDEWLIQVAFHSELIDALYKLACWYYELFLKSEKK